MTAFDPSFSLRFSFVVVRFGNKSRGDSGGPLIDESGKLVGVASFVDQNDQFCRNQTNPDGYVDVSVLLVADFLTDNGVDLSSGGGGGCCARIRAAISSAASFLFG